MPRGRSDLARRMQYGESCRCPMLLLVLVVIAAAYVVAAEGLKTWSYRQAP